MITLIAILVIFFFVISTKSQSMKINGDGDNILKMRCRKVEVLEENTYDRSYQKSMKISNNIDNTASVDIHNVRLILQEVWVKDEVTGEEEKLTFKNRGIDIRKGHKLNLYYAGNNLEYVKNTTFKNRVSHLRNACQPGNAFIAVVFNILIGLFSIIPVVGLLVITASIQQYSKIKQPATRAIYKYDFLIVPVFTILLTLIFFSDSFKALIVEYVSLVVSLAIMRGIVVWFSINKEKQIHNYYMSFIAKN